MINNLPALQIILPLFGGLLSALSFRKNIAWVISCTTILVNSIVVFYLLIDDASSISYVFGGFEAPVGIEYRLDNLNLPIILFINITLLFLLIFGKQLIQLSVLDYLAAERQHFFYAALLFAHTGYVGMLSSNDMFNIYVFIEISSLATYVLMAMGRSSKALVGAFDYLVMGTIGATLILIGIGFLLYLTGSLNISDIKYILSQNSQGNNNITIIAISFFLCGAILKTAFFPMHFWMIRAYNSVPPIILTYIAAISSAIGIYIIVRFVHFSIDIKLIQASFNVFILPMSFATIVICTFFAMNAKNIKTIIIYSTCSQIGYIFLLLTVEEYFKVMSLLIFFDALNKVALFTLLAHIQHRVVNLNISNFKALQFTKAQYVFIFMSLMFSAGLPLSSMFLLKIKIFEAMLKRQMILSFIVITISSVFALLYHLKIIKCLFFTNKDSGIATIKTNMSGFYLIVICQFLTMIYFNQIIGCFNEYSKSILV